MAENFNIKPLYSIDSVEAAGAASGDSANKIISIGDDHSASISKPSWAKLSRETIRRFGFLLVGLSLIIGIISFVILLGFTSIDPSQPRVTLSILLINGVLVSLLFGLIVREALILLRARRKRRAAARLHIRIVGLFSLVAALPAILVAVVAGITLDARLDRWFEERTRSIVNSAVSLGESYLQASARGLTGASLTMASEIDRARQLYYLDRTGFVQFITNQAKGRGMLAARILHNDGSEVVAANIEQQELVPPPANITFAAADKGIPASIAPGNSNFVGTVIKLKELPGFYLYTVGLVNPSVMKNRRFMQEITEEYKQLENNRLSQQLAFALLYLGICMIVLLSAVWTGLSVADRLVDPIRNLITAAAKVSSGELGVRVESARATGDLRDLTETFNDMTQDLRQQRNRLVAANNQIDQRRRFTETVLSGVSAGVISVNPTGKISIFNRAAVDILNTNDETLHGANLKDIQAQIYDSFEEARVYKGGEYLEQITIKQNGEERTLNVQIAKEGLDENQASYVITFDDITELVSAQRTSAWADVARRIAHEIKNPLTPIQLSAERIKRRYGKVIKEDREVFDQCTDTIVRQVSDIGRMVDEFSSFARMPKPTMESGDLGDHIKEAFFLQEVANPHIEFNLDLGGEPLVGRFDKRLLAQAFTNIIKNATEAIEGYAFEEGEKGRIDVIATKTNNGMRVDVMDNGKGLPVEGRQRLLEPYMTTRTKGTGLGLAIVSKVFEEHGGSIELLDRPDASEGAHGALVRLNLPFDVGHDQGES